MERQPKAANTAAAAAKDQGSELAVGCLGLEGLGVRGLGFRIQALGFRGYVGTTGGNMGGSLFGITCGLFGETDV